VTGRTKPHWLDRATLVAGTVFTVTALTLAMVAGARVGLESPASAQPAASFTPRPSWVLPLLFPLGLITGGLALGALLRLGDFRSLRSRMRLATLFLLLATTLVDFVVMTPLEERLAAAAPNAAALAAEVDHLNQWSWARAALLVVLGTTLVVAHRAPLPAVVEVSSTGLTRHHRALLLLLGTATLFEGYDRFIASLALPYIGRDLGAAEGGLGFALAAIRLGALVSLLFGRMADRYGRRRLLIASVVAYTLATAATGFSRGLLDFAACQLVAVIFLSTELTLAQVIIAEEFPAAMRGFGQGVLGAFAALGAGVAAMLFPLLQRSAYGWRGMYLIGLLPLVMVAYLQRHLPETQRWQRLGAGGQRQARLLDVWQADLRGRLMILTGLTAMASATAAPAFSFATYRATTIFHWGPGQVSALILGGGTVGFLGYFIIGRLSDMLGRRLIGGLGLMGGAVAVVVFYQTDWLLPAFALLTFMESGIVIAVNALGTELFPTHLRATAKSWITNASILGALFGFSAVGVLSEITGGHAPVVTALAALTFFLAPLIGLLPETRQADLQEVASP